jgi:protein-ribulosamine 3-kinase
VKANALSAAIAAAVAAASGKPFAIAGVEPVGGGCIHEAVKLGGNHGGAARSFFAKINLRGRATMFDAESDGLDALRQAAAVRVPGTVARGESEEHAFLVLEWLDLHPLDAASAARLGTALALQHRATRERFGWPRDNFIGATPQENAQDNDWHAFFRDRRLLPQLRLAAANRLPSRMLDRGERLLADCGAFFRGHRPAASLLHGDLWSGNAAALADGTPVLFDPAAYAGDREADVAMTQLFGGFPADFAAAYGDAWRLPDDHVARRDLYNLYHVLNHANLFAGGYVRQAEDTIARLLAEVG